MCAWCHSEVSDQLTHQPAAFITTDSPPQHLSSSGFYSEVGLLEQEAALVLISAY